MKAPPKVNYVRNGPIVVLKNKGGVNLSFGELEFTDTRWVITLEVFEQMQKQNPGVTFVDVGPNPK